MKSTSVGNSHKTTRAERTVQEYIAIMARGKWLLLGILGASLLAAFLYSKLATPVYKAVVTVMIDQKLPTLSVMIDPTVRGNLQNIKNEIEVLRSRSISDTVARRLLQQRWTDESHTKVLPILKADDAASADVLAPLPVVTGRVDDAVDFDNLRDTDIIKIIAQSNDPREAALIANLYAQAYYDRNIYVSRSKSRALREFLEGQLRDKREGLDEVEGKMQQYMETQGIVSLDDESRKVIEQLSQLEATRDATDISIKSLATTQKSLKEQFPQQEADVARLIGEGNDQYIHGLQEEIARLEVQRDVTVAQNPDYVGQDIYNQKLKEIDDQIGALKSKLKQRTDAFVSTLPAANATEAQGDPAAYLKQLKQNIVQNEIEIQSLDSKKKALDAVIRQYNVQFEKIPKKSIQFARLQRTKLSNEKLFLLVESKYNEAAIAERSEFGYITITDPATVPGAPARPNLMLNLLIGFSLGLALGLGAVFVKEHLDIKVQATEDLKKLGYNVLASVMKMDDELRHMPDESEVPRYGRDMDPHLLTLFLPFSPIAESYRLMRTALHYPKSTDHPRTILVTSPNPGEGKTTTVANLAISLAQTGKRVLLMDCDLRKPNIHTVFGIELKPGLSELLFKTGSHEISVNASVVKNLDILCAGSLSPNPSENLGSQEMMGLIDQAKQEYEVVLCDASPVLAASDASVLSTRVDAVIMVLSAGMTRMTDVDHAMELLENVGGKVLGFVLNNFDLQKAYGIPYAHRGYGYYGYSYHSNNGKNGTRKKSRKERYT